MSEPDPTRDRAPDHAAFMASFADAWARPDADRFVELLAPDVRLLQPLTPVVVGRTAAHEEFVRLLRWLPDIHGIIDTRSSSQDTVLVAWRLCFSLGRSPRQLPLVDRIVLREGLIAERQAYFDSASLALAILARPRAWLPFLRYRAEGRR